MLPCRTVLLLALLAMTSLARADVSNPKPLFLEGYAGQVSYKPGEELSLHVSTSAPKFAVEIARLGAQRDVVFTKPDVPGVEAPILDSSTSPFCLSLSVSVNLSRQRQRRRETERERQKDEDKDSSQPLSMCQSLRSPLRSGGRIEILDPFQGELRCGDGLQRVVDRRDRDEAPEGSAAELIEDDFVR